jgi:transposase
MLTWEDDVDIHALRRRGWSISAIARHVGRDRKTVRTYLTGDREPGVRQRRSDPFAPFVDYIRARLTEDPHLWALTLFDELQDLGFGLSYPSLTRVIRARKLRPACPACGGATERPNAIIEHPPGEETQWDWLDLPDPPTQWGWGQDGASAGRFPRALRPLAGGAGAVDGSAASGRRLGPGLPRVRRGH